MSLAQFTNNANTTLGSAVSSTATSITVATGTGSLFPSLSGSQYFSATLFSAGSTTGTPNEIVYVTARSGDTMTVLRGQEGTTAQNWNVGDTFSNFLTAGYLNGLIGPQDLQSQFGNSAGDTGTANAGSVILTPAPTSLSNLMFSPIRVMKTGAANTGTYTLNVNALGAKTVLLNGQALQAGQLAASTLFEVLWDGSNFELISTPAETYNSGLAPMSASTVKANLTGSTATPSDVTLTALLSSMGFGASSIASNGYITIPAVVSGVARTLIIQWGSANAPTDGSSSYSFPLTFPTAGLQIIGGTPSSNYLATNGNKVGAGFVSTSMYYVYSDDVGVPVSWIAIGY